MSGGIALCNVQRNFGRRRSAVERFCKLIRADGRVVIA